MKSDFDLNFDIPDIACGAVIPHGVQLELLKEEKRKEELEAQRKHDFWIATYGIIGGLISGMVSGVVASLIVLKLQGLL